MPLVLSREEATAVYCALKDIQKRKPFRELNDKAHQEVCIRCLTKKVHEFAYSRLAYSEFAKAYKLHRRKIWD